MTDVFDTTPDDDSVQQIPIDPGVDPTVTPTTPDTSSLIPETQPDYTDGFIFEEDMSCWCEPGTPDDWATWTSPTEPAPDSFTDQGYSPDWGQVEPAWAENGQDPFPSTEPEVTLNDDLGPGHEADIYWQDQGQTQYCALYSVRSILAEYYGVDVSAQEVVDRARANGWYGRDAYGTEGVLPEHVDDIFASFGVPSHNYQGEAGAFQALNDALLNDQRIVLALDSKEIDAGGDVGPYGGIDSDHAVSVTGIDYDRNVVIVNDSARGAGLEIPMNVFYESWRDSNFSMTITDVSMDGGSMAQPPAGAGEFVSETPGYSVLPITLHPSFRGSAA